MINVKVGDMVTRNMAGILMKLEVMAVKPLIICRGGWEFDPETGIEVDEYLGWGPKTGVSGSFLVQP